MSVYVVLMETFEGGKRDQVVTKFEDMMEAVRDSFMDYNAKKVQIEVVMDADDVVAFIESFPVMREAGHEIAVAP